MTTPRFPSPLMIAQASCDGTTPIRVPAPDARLAVEMGVMDAMVDIHRATDADSMRAAFRAARTAMAPALAALDREAAHYNTCAGQVWPIVAPEEPCETCDGRGCGDCRNEDDPRVMR